MSDARDGATPLASLRPLAFVCGRAARRQTRPAGNALRFTIGLMLVLPGVAFGPAGVARATAASKRLTTAAKKAPAQQGRARGRAMSIPPAAAGPGKSVAPETRRIKVFPPVNVQQLVYQEALAPAQAEAIEIRAINPPQGPPDREKGLPPMAGVGGGDLDAMDVEGREAQAPVASATGVSPAPHKTFKGEFETGGSIPPDTMGAVGTTHIVTPTNERMSIQTRDGVSLARFTLNSFWAGVVLEGGATPATFDPKIYFDRFNNRFIFVVTSNSVSSATRAASSTLVAVSQTADPTGAWNRFAIDVDPTATANAGQWADYPSVGFNKNWIAVNINRFQYGNVGGGVIGTTAYNGPAIYVLDKQAAYSNTLSTVTAFQQNQTTCQFNDFGCGFTMVPSVAEDDTSETIYLLEDWNSTSGILRLGKITGTPAAPVLTSSIQAPSSPLSWRFGAQRITTTGGYLPMRQRDTYAPDTGTRIMGNDSRIQNVVLRNGTLWAVHHVMVGPAPTPAGTSVGTATNPDVRTAVQWWEIDPSVEDDQNLTPPLQRGRIEDPTADNCHNGSAGLRTGASAIPCAAVRGQFFNFPTIAVNQNEDVLIGFSMMSPLTYPNAGYAFRAASDAPNTMRDHVIFRAGQGFYNIGAGSGVNRQNRWGDYSASQTDPLNDTDFWTIQEYAGAQRDFGLGAITGNWETWWAQVRPTGPTPVNISTNGLIVSEFRLRGPQGPRDEFVELYNPSNSPVRITAPDNSDGWGVGFHNATNASPLTTVPYGTVVPARGHLLVTNNQNGPGGGPAAGPTETYGLTDYPSVTAPGTPPGFVRGADGDAGHTVDTPDNQGVAIFNTSDLASMTLANRIDAAGFASAPALFKEGTGIADITGTPAGQISFQRRQAGASLSAPGAPQDTGNNAADFLFVDPVVETLGVQPALGAAGPQNLDGPVVEPNLGVDRFDVTAAIGSPPNRVRRLCAPLDPLVEECNASRSTLGTISMRRRVTNYTGAPVSRLRWRLSLTSTTPAPVGTADLRAITSSDITVNGQPVKGTTLEEPPTQTIGGGWNASWSVALPTPLAAGATVNVQFLFGVQQGGTFSVLVQTEALP